MQLTIDRLPSPIGTMLLVCDGDGVLRALDFDDCEDRLHRLLRLQYGRYAVQRRTLPNAITRPIAAYFAGDIAAIEAIPVATGGTAFQRRVWGALRRLPPGSTSSYGTLAASLGQPSASRAVGLANGANPVAIVVPCHRVIGWNGALTGYGGGLSRKRWLLEHEGVRLGPARVAASRVESADRDLLQNVE
jgi:O-6-methylguanine DNA methyltransferase